MCYHNSIESNADFTVDIIIIVFITVQNVQSCRSTKYLVIWNRAIIWGVLRGLSSQIPVKINAYSQFPEKIKSSFPVPSEYMPIPVHRENIVLIPVPR
jgi:hypothetical protein